jgi:hypothetical protein
MRIIWNTQVHCVSKRNSLWVLEMVIHKVVTVLTLEALLFLLGAG